MSARAVGALACKAIDHHLGQFEVWGRTMIWVKSALVGFAAAFIAVVVVVAVVFVTASWHIDVGEGGGGIGFVSVGFGGVLMLPVIFAFAIGLWWSVRRERKKRLAGTWRVPERFLAAGYIQPPPGSSGQGTERLRMNIEIVWREVQ